MGNKVFKTLICRYCNKPFLQVGGKKYGTCYSCSEKRHNKHGVSK